MKHSITKPLFRAATATALGSILALSAIAPTLAGAMPKGHSDAGGYSTNGYQSPAAELAQINNPQQPAAATTQPVAQSPAPQAATQAQQGSAQAEGGESAPFYTSGPVSSGN